MEEIKKTKTEFEEISMEYEPDVLPTTDIDSFIDEFQYGLSVPKLNQNNREVDTTVIDHTHDGVSGQGGQISYNNLTNLPTLYTPKYYQVNDTRWNGGFTAGNFTVTCGFRPKRIDLKAHTAFPNDGMSVGTAIVNELGNIVNGCIFWDASYTGVFDTSASSIGIIKSSSSSTAITITAITDTGFTVNVNNNTWNFNATFTVEG